MMNIETRELPFWVDQPDKVGPLLLEALQQTLNSARTRNGRRISQTSHHVLIIDAQKERVQYLYTLLSTAGYRVVVATTPVDAFTLFLQGSCMPFTIILGQEEQSNRFFLNRLFTQITQKYDWGVLVLRLVIQPSSRETLRTPAFPSFRPPETAPFPPTNDIMTHTQSLQYSPITPLPPVTTGPLPSAPQLSGQLPSIQMSPPMSPTTTPPPESPTEPKKGKDAKLGRIALEGQDIGRYHITSLVGEVSLGETLTSNVYQVYDRLRGQNIAMKTLRTDAFIYQSETETEEDHLFKKEMDLLEPLDHSHILPVLNVGNANVSGASFIYKTMPHYQEGSLAQWLHHSSNARAFPPQEVLPVLFQLADALQYLHNHTILFQNFKFSNLIVRNPAKNLRSLHLLLADFPVVQDGSFFSHTAEAYPYMAPERWMGIALPASDQYALGAIIYELLTGRPPFQGSSEHTMKHLHMNMQPQPPRSLNPKLSPGMNDVLLRALAKRQDDRFASVSEFARAMQRYA